MLKRIMDHLTLGKFGIREWVKTAHDLAMLKGWYDKIKHADWSVWDEKIALLHSEVSEVLEAYRAHKLTTTISDSGKPEGVPPEIADIIIRLLDLCGHLDIDLEAAMVESSGLRDRRLSMAEWEAISAKYMVPGFVNGQDTAVPKCVVYIHKCISEAYDAPRKLVPAILAKLMLMTLAMAKHLGLDIEAEVELKHNYNLTRKYRHGNKRV
jgi:NTP pyrophosphatase (non-canonical NTP hydrolase)